MSRQLRSTCSAKSIGTGETQQIPPRRHQLPNDWGCSRTDQQPGIADDLRAERRGPDQYRHPPAGFFGLSPMSTSKKCYPSISLCSDPEGFGVGKSTGVSLHPERNSQIAAHACGFSCSTFTTSTGRCFGDRALVLNPRNLKASVLAVQFRGNRPDVLFAGRPGVPDELDILAEVIPAAKSMYTQYQNSGPGRTENVAIPSRSVSTGSIRRVPYRLVDLISMIDDRMGKLENRFFAHHLSQADLAH